MKKLATYRRDFIFSLTMTIVFAILAVVDAIAIDGIGVIIAMGVATLWGFLAGSNFGSMTTLKTILEISGEVDQEKFN